jgi:CheY-like chemotaxis protein
MPRANSVLVADHARAHSLIAACLPGRTLQFAQTVEAAKAALARQEFDAVIVGLQFDESRMFTLVDHLRTRPSYRGLPVICVRTLPTLMPRELQGCVEQALRMVGISAYVEIDPADPVAISARLRRLIDGTRRPAASAPGAGPEG